MENYNESHSGKSVKLDIGIVYLAVGRYSLFWDEFYESCEKFLFPDANKTYFVFSDRQELLTLDLPNVTPLYLEDRGWMMSTCAKSECMIRIEGILSALDYLFYLNANYKVLKPIYCKEILPLERDNYLVSLSFHVFDNVSVDKLPYDRNPACNAYMATGQGERYYQGGFYGGRTPEVLAYAHWCDKVTKDDLAKGIVAKNHDESYLNKYLAGHRPKRVSTFHSRPEEWDIPVNCKAIFREKNHVLGKENVTQLKSAFLNHSMSWLYDKDFKLNPVHIVDAVGGLGNQMFQYAFLLGLQHGFPQNRHYWDKKNVEVDKSHNGYELERVFAISGERDLPDELAGKIKDIPPSCIRYVYDMVNKYEPVKEDWQLVTVYWGFWQSEKYFNRIPDLVRTTFRFDETKLNSDSYRLLQQIRHSESVSIHFRRGDYHKSYENRYLYDNICVPDYYEKAIQEIKKRVEEPLIFYVFSDEPAWVKEHIDIPGCVVVDCNRAEDNWQDMCLMSACKHNITANSSFSWWAAWLNDNNDKKVIVPSPWLNWVEHPDIIPDTWIKIQVQESVCRLDLTDVTIVIPFVSGSREQIKYLDVLLDYISIIADTAVIVLEIGDKQQYKPGKEYSNTTFLFEPDSNRVFHRTHYLNCLFRRIASPVVGIWDTDVILPPEQVARAVSRVRRGEAVISYPYDGRLYEVRPICRDLFVKKVDIDILKCSINLHTLLSDYSMEGALFVERSLYIQVGGENERIGVQSIEPVERMKRAEILELPVYRADGPLFRLQAIHEELPASEKDKIEIESRIELLNICRMTKTCLENYIQKW